MEHNRRNALIRQYLGKTVTVIVDRPLGSVHPQHPGIVYAVNYGYIAGEIAPDGEALDAYVLGVHEPLRTFTGRVIAAIRRMDDIEDKLVVASEGMMFSAAEIAEAVRFQEQYYTSRIETI